MVRISKYKSTFTNGYEANFTQKFFKIRIIHSDPAVYEIEDIEGKPIICKFYE